MQEMNYRSSKHDLGNPRRPQKRRTLLRNRMHCHASVVVCSNAFAVLLCRRRHGGSRTNNVGVNYNVKNLSNQVHMFQSIVLSDFFFKN